MISRTPRLRDACRRPSIDGSAPTTADARDEPSTASASIARRPPEAHDALCNRPPTALNETADPAHRRIGRTEARTAGGQLSRRQRRGFHPDSALAIDSDEGAPAVRETLGLRSPPRRAMLGYACACRGAVLPIASAGLEATAPRDRGEQIRRATEGAPGPRDGDRGPRLFAFPHIRASSSRIGGIVHA